MIAPLVFSVLLDTAVALPLRICKANDATACVAATLALPDGVADFARLRYRLVIEADDVFVGDGEIRAEEPRAKTPPAHETRVRKRVTRLLPHASRGP